MIDGRKNYSEKFIAGNLFINEVSHKNGQRQNDEERCRKKYHCIFQRQQNTFIRVDAARKLLEHHFEIVPGEKQLPTLFLTKCKKYGIDIDIQIKQQKIYQRHDYHRKDENPPFIIDFFTFSRRFHSLYLSIRYLDYIIIRFIIQFILYSPILTLYDFSNKLIKQSNVL
ncbi:MAG: hypothetical protein ACLR06_02735 [Christensenellaceae bacterium]